MKSECGRYFFLSLVDSCALSQLDLITAKLTYSAANLAELSCNPYGAQCLKKLIKVLQKEKSSSLTFRFTTTLSFRLYTIMTNTTGSNIIQECLEVFNDQQNAPLYLELAHCCIDLATHERGCVSLNRAIHSARTRRAMRPVYKLCTHAVQLAYDPYGHFVIQFILRMQRDDFNEVICGHIQGHYLALSTREGGSHVVEECLKSKSRSFALNELMWGDKLGEIVSDRYGKHVVKTAIRETQISDYPAYRSLTEKIISIKGRLGRGEHGVEVIKFIYETYDSFIRASKH